MEIYRVNNTPVPSYTPSSKDRSVRETETSKDYEVDISHVSSTTDALNLIKYAIHRLDSNEQIEMESEKENVIKDKIRNNHYSQDAILDVVTESIINFNLLF